MGWRTKAIVDRPTELPEDLLAAYEPTRVPAGRTTGLPPVTVARRFDPLDVEAAEPPAERVLEVAPVFPLRRADAVVPDPIPAVAVTPAVVVEPAAVGADDRRGAPRHHANLPVLVTLEGTDVAGVGRSANVSAGGLLLRMPFTAPDRHFDLVVGDDECALLWAKVVDERPTDGDYLWHMQVVTSDDDWSGLVARAASTARS